MSFLFVRKSHNPLYFQLYLFIYAIDMHFKQKQQLSRFYMSIQNLLILGVILAILPQAYSVTGVDIGLFTPYTPQAYQCMRNNGIRFVIPRGYHQYGKMDLQAVQNLQNARAVGMDTDIYMLHCRTKSPIDQVDQMMSTIPDNLYGKVWVNVVAQFTPACYWTPDPQSNCQYVKDIVTRIQSHGKKVGIFSNPTGWTIALGSRYACAQLAQYPLWYSQWDNSTSFSKFSAFGGWSKPTMKQYQRLELCSSNITLNFHP